MIWNKWTSIYKNKITINNEKVWSNLKSTVYTVNNAGIAYKSQNIFALLFYFIYCLH